jgi:hypothetical protein
MVTALSIAIAANIYLSVLAKSIMRYICVRHLAKEMALLPMRWLINILGIVTDEKRCQHGRGWQG